MIVGLDLGTVHLGACVALGGIPLTIADAGTPPVNRHDLDATARDTRAWVDHWWGAAPFPPDVVIELGALYIPKDASPQQARAMAENHATMSALLALIYQALPGPFYRVHVIARRTWSSRVVPHHQGGVSNVEASAGLAAWLDPASAWPLLSDQHRRDACGAIIGHLLGAPLRSSRPNKPGRKRKPRPPRPPTPRQLAERRQDAAADRLLEGAQARLAALPPPTAPPPPPRCPHGCGATPHAGLCRRPYGRQP